MKRWLAGWLAERSIASTGQVAGATAGLNKRRGSYWGNGKGASGMFGATEPGSVGSSHTQAPALPSRQSLLLSGGTKPSQPAHQTNTAHNLASI